MQRFFIHTILVSLVFCISCSRRPSYVMPEDKMVDVLCDIRLAQAIYQNEGKFDTDKKKDALIAGVLEKHKITQADLDSSLLWYSDNMSEYMTITDSVASKLKVRNDLMSSSRIARESQSSKTSSYIIPPFFNLNESSPTMSFDIDSFKIKDVNLPSFCLKFNIQGLNSMQKGEAALFFTYKDTLIRKVIALDKNTNYTFTKPQLADSLLKSISGYVHISNRIKGMSSNVLLHNISYSDSTLVSSISEGIDNKNLPKEENTPKPAEPVAEPKNSPSGESNAVEKTTNKEVNGQAVVPKERLDRNPMFRNRRQSTKQR